MGGSPELRDVFALLMTNAFKEAFSTSSSKYVLSIAVPFQVPVDIVPKVVIELKL